MKAFKVWFATLLIAISSLSLTGMSASAASVAYPSISGTPAVGTTLTASAGTWDAGTTPTLQWYRDNVKIVNATGATYTPVEADYLHSLSVVATANVNQTQVVRHSAPIARVGAGSLTLSAPTSFAAQISTASSATCAVQLSGSIQCSGNSVLLGNGSGSNSTKPVTVSGISNAVSVDLSLGTFACALLRDGTAKCWGVNYLGKLGNGSLKSSSKPEDVSGLTKAVQISTGQNFACALIQDGTVKCWGSNGAGELGTSVGLKSTTVSGEPRQYSDKPVSVVGVTNAVQITTGSDYACALLQAGTVKCWGGNLKGDIEGLSNVVSISADLSSLCALLSNGRIKCLGSSNYFGELGNGTGLQESKVMTPTEVVGITNATQIANGFNSACAILATGVLKCWGQSFDSSPITVASGSAVVNQVARPALHFCRILQNANVECWGANNNGQVTDGSKVERSAPVQTFEFGKQFANVPTAKITGSALIGSVLTGVPGSWPAGAQLTYAWLKNGSPISGATATSLTLTEAMNGSTIQFQVTGTAAGYATAKSVSAATAQVAYPSIPVQGTPKITSSLSSVRIGAVLTVNVGTWAEGVQTTIDWKVDGQSVQNSGTTLEVTSQMQGKVISVVVTATKSGFATATKTVTTKAVAKGQILKTRDLTIGADGAYSVGAILGLNWGTSPDPMLEDLDYSIRYVWKVNGVVIADATDSQYQIRQSDLGKKLSASITLSMPGYEDIVLTSKSTTAVVKGNLLN